MIPRYRNKAFKRLSVSFLLVVLTFLLLSQRGFSLPSALVAICVILLATFAVVFYIQGNIALAEAKGYDSSVVAAIIIVSALCTGGLFFGMPLIILFGLKDRLRRRRHSHRPEPTITCRKPAPGSSAPEGEDDA